MQVSSTAVQWRNAIQDAAAVKHVRVESSNVHSIAYDATSKQMEVKFKNGGTYRYDGISPSDHSQLLNADSIGSHLAKHIVGTFPHRTVR